MTQLKPALIIAIPAHNEQANIVELLKSLLSQLSPNFSLKQIVVICDGCTDATAKLAKSVKDPRIVVQDDGKRLGKNARLNKVFTNFNADILVVCDADIVLSSRSVIQQLIEPFFKSTRLGISCAYHTPLTPSNLIQQIGFFGFQVWDTARKLKGESAIRYYCEGALRAFSKKFVTALHFPENTPLDEDSFSFYAAITKGFSVKVVPSAKIHFKLPQTLSEYFYQLKRYLSAPSILSEHFPVQLLQRYEVITPSVKLHALFLNLIRKPFLGLLYLPLQFVLKLQMLSYKPPVIWTTSASTKTGLS